MFYRPLPHSLVGYAVCLIVHATLAAFLGRRSNCFDADFARLLAHGGEFCVWRKISDWPVQILIESTSILQADLAALWGFLVAIAAVQSWLLHRHAVPPRL